MSFDTSFDRLMVLEGAFVNNPADKGGPTKWGISQRSYPKMTLADIQNLTRDEAKVIYKRDFWDRGSMEQFDPAIAFQVFTSAVNLGSDTAIRMLQRAADVADDGHVGPYTIAAIKAKSVTDMVMLFIAELIEFYTRCADWVTFSKGWSRRAAADLRYAAQDS